MEPDDYCEIFCSHFIGNEPAQLYDYIGEFDEFFRLDNGDGLEFSRVERHRCPLMGTTTIIYYFDYLPFESFVNIFVVVGFRIAITIHHVDDSEIEDHCL